MIRISVVLAFVCACAGFGAAVTPRYIESLRVFDEFESHITEHLLSMDGDIPPLTDYRRHYAVIVTQIGEFSKWLANTCLFNYEQDYINQLGENVPLGFVNPQYVIDEGKLYLSLARNNTQKLTSLIKSACFNHEPVRACNVVIDQAVHGDPIRYKDEAEILHLLSEMASHYLEHADDMVSSSRNYLAVSYLVKNVNTFENLVFSADRIHRKFNLNMC